MKHLALVALFLAGLFSARAQTQWQDRYTVKHPSGNLSLPADWQPRYGLHLNVRSADGASHLQIRLAPTACGAWIGTAPIGVERKRAGWLGKLLGQDRTHGEAVAHLFAYPERLPAQAAPQAVLVLKCRPDMWSVYLEDRPILVFPPPFESDFTVSQPLDEIPADIGGDVRFQKVGPYQFAADFMIPADDPNKLGPWRSEIGTWKVHSAMEDAVEQQANPRIEQRPLEAERSANFYCLAGSGELGIVTTGYKFLDDYAMQASVLLHAGESGLVFYYQDPENYYEYTMTVADNRADRVLLKLRRHSSRRIPRIQVLGAAEARLTADQWVLPRVEVYNQRIVCYLDNQQVMEVREDLPVGGKFGLSVRAPQSIRFDDVLVHSLNRLDLQDLNWIGFHQRGMYGDFLGANRSWLPVPSPIRGAGALLEPPYDSSPKWLFLGSPLNEPHVFQASFRPHAVQSEFGLIVGYPGRDEAGRDLPYLRFVREASAQYERFSLYRIQGDGQTELETWRRPWPRPPVAEAPIRLMADPTEPGQLRLYANGELVLVHRLTEPLPGGVGLYVGPRTGVRIGDLDYRLQRTDLYRNRQEKNQIYVTDPYMRHWSSPEGQWIQDADGIMWHKGDFLGRFVIHLPYVAQSELHLGVPEGWSRGELVVSVSGLNMSVVHEDLPAARTRTIASATLPESAAATPAPAPATAAAEAGAAAPVIRPAYAVHFEDTLVWGTDADGNELFKVHLDQPLAGHRVRLAGFTYDHLMYSHVEMYRLMDYLFSEAPHDWIINGGRWQVINRFQCDPRWSHFNGENGEGLAALWSKYRFGGDFCLEMYAGVRHGNEWYARAGDLNLTMLNQTTSVGDGYTVETTAWDQNLSQLWSYLYRAGIQAGKSGKYLVPRRREGNVRIFQNPLLGTGRPVHGAWYYLKLRRVGPKIEYYFDNEKIFEYVDDQPISMGSMGIWTFMESMMVARVRVAADRIEPATFEVRQMPLTDDPPRSPEAALPFDTASSEAVLLHGSPAVQTLPDAWTNADKVAHGQLAWHLDARLEPYFTFDNVLGGGAMAVKAVQPDLPLGDVAGWRFYVKRTSGAAFNFHYSIGKIETVEVPPAEGETRAADAPKVTRTDYREYYRYFHRLSGSDFSLGPCRQAGETEIRPVPAVTDLPWHEAGEWQQVTVWLPVNRIDDPASSTWLVRVEGFGELQPTELLKGLTANHPGEAYAIKGFTTIRNAAPVLSLAPDAPRFNQFVLLDRQAATVQIRADSLDPLAAWIARQDFPNLHQVVLRAIDRQGGGLQQELLWVTLPAQPQVALVWDDQLPNALQLKSLVDFPDRRLATAVLEVNGVRVPLRDRGPGIRVGYVPRDPLLLTGETFTATVSAGEFALSKQMAWAGDGDAATPGMRQGTRLDEAPVLMGFDPLPTAFFLNGEARKLPPDLVTATTNSKVIDDDPDQGAFLRTYNNAVGQRLAITWNVPFNLARYPLFQFRYRASEQAAITLNYGTIFFATLNEPPFYANRRDKNYAAHAVRCATPFLTDNAWHTWQGVLADVPAREPLDFRLLASPGLTFSSFGGEDQTGRFSTVDYDELVLGPAVRSPEQLACTPIYFDPDGIVAVHVAVHNGATAYRDLFGEARDQIEWQTAKPGERLIPSLANLAQGICHLFIQAEDTRGRKSAVTDLPFLYDNTPLTAAGAIHPWADPVGNGVALHIALGNDGYAPADLPELKFSVGGETVDVSTQLAQIVHDANSQTLILDYPHIFKQRLDAMKDGDTFNLEVAGIVDGAGNPSPALATAIKVNYAGDKIGPAWLPAKLPENIDTSTMWEGRNNKPLYFEPARYNPTAMVHTRGQEPFLRTQTYGAAGSVTLKTRKWDLAAFPYLAFRLKKPANRAENPTSILMTLTSRQDHKYVISLTEPRRGGNYLDIGEPLAWTADTWQTVSLNVYEQLVKKVGRYEANRQNIHTISITRGTAESAEVLDIQGLFVYGPWRSTDTILLDAYDASGVKGVDWQVVDAGGSVMQEGQVDGLKLTPASLGIVKALPTSWLLLYARDAVGNRSVPLRLPYPGVGDPTAHELEKELEKK